MLETANYQRRPAPGQRKCGGKYDESGLDYAKFRYYNSTTGRFMSPDPLAGNVMKPQSWNRYAYVLNNPLKYVDPLGLDCVYLSDDAMRIEEVNVDGDTSPFECGWTGGNYVPGSLTGYGTYDDGTISNFIYTPYPAANTGSPLDSFFQNWYAQQNIQNYQSGVAATGGGVPASPTSHAAMVQLHDAFNKFPNICNAGVFVFAGGESEAFIGEADNSEGLSGGFVVGNSGTAGVLTWQPNGQMNPPQLLVDVPLTSGGVFVQPSFTSAIPTSVGGYVHTPNVMGFEAGVGGYVDPHLKNFYGCGD